MITNSTTAGDRLGKLGIHLPGAPTPFGAYVPAVQTGKGKRGHLRLYLPNQRLKLTGAAILVFCASTSLQAAPAA
jgi:hypothetical protein